MFRQASRLLARALGTAGRRSFATDLSATPATDATFVEAWKKVVPSIDPPKTPLAFMKPRPSTPAFIPSKLTVNFVLSYQSELSSKEQRKLIHVPMFAGKEIKSQSFSQTASGSWMRVEQEQKVTEDAHRFAEQDAAA